MINLLILIITFFFISISIIGYGSIFLKIFYRESQILNFGYLGIFGLVFSIFISYFTNFFLPHDYIFNLIFLIIGLIGFIFFIKQFSRHLLKKEFISFVVIFSIVLTSLLIFKNHDDFPYYHFVYTYNLTQFDLNIGIGQFNHGFRTPSSIFYINSLFFLPLIKYFSFNFTAVLVLLFANIILLKKIGITFSSKILSFKKELNQPYVIILFSLLSLMFINIFFYRIGEHGTDRSAQILVMLLIIEIIYALHKKDFDNILNLKIFTLFIFIISLKAFYILYLLLLLPLYYSYYKSFKSHYLVIKNLLSGYLYFYFLIFLLILSSYFFNTGCLLYPIEITCFDNLSWSIPIKEVELMNQWYQQWSKAGAAPGFRVDNPEIYIKYFNWVENWIDKYFFNKVSDFLLGIIFLSLVIFTSFKMNSKNKDRFKIGKKYKFLYIIVLILFFEWFYNHPALRYGGYNLISIIFFLPISIYLSAKKISVKNLKLLITIFVILTFIIFSGRNINRIYKENILYDYNPFKQPFYKVEIAYFNEYKNLKKLISNYYNCKQNNDCSENRLKMKYGFFIFNN